MSERKAWAMDRQQAERALNEAESALRDMQAWRARAVSAFDVQSAEGCIRICTDAIEYWRGMLDGIPTDRETPSQYYSDTRPLDAKNIPGAHGAYR